MAPLKVIGAGFGRTGTLSLCFALDILGYTCHHMEKLLLDPKQNADDFTNAYHDRTADWDRVFADYDAAVDWPAAEFWPELVQRYPEAKVILTVRNAEDWYRSVGKTIKDWPMDPSSPWPERMLKARRMARTIVKEGALREHANKDAMIAKFRENTERVKAAIPADRLLIYNPGDGWGPLCEFLGVDVPNFDYPHCNRGGDFADRLRWVKESIESGENLAAMPFKMDAVDKIYEERRTANLVAPSMS